MEGSESRPWRNVGDKMKRTLVNFFDCSVSVLSNWNCYLQSLSYRMLLGRLGECGGGGGCRDLFQGILILNP